MKIIDVVCAQGKTGFYFDDQKAIKAGAGHDGAFYIGEPMTEASQPSVRQANQSLSCSYLTTEPLRTAIVLLCNIQEPADATRCSSPKILFH